MQCLCVTKNHHFFFARAERWRREARRPLGLAGRRPSLVMLMVILDSDDCEEVEDDGIREEAGRKDRDCVR